MRYARLFRILLSAAAWSALSLALGLGAARAQSESTAEEEPLVGDRPDFTESALTIAPGRFQVETGLTFIDESSEDVEEIGELLFRIGLTRRVELRVTAGSYVRVEPDFGNDLSGLSNSAIGAKIGLTEGDTWTTALLIGTTLPTGSSDFRDSSLQPSAVFAAERDLTGNVSLGTNLGYVHASADGERFGEALASVAVGVDLGETTGAFFEVFGVIPESSDAGPEAYFFDTGLTRLLSPNFQLDVRAGVGLNSNAADFLAGAGLIWRY
jgi:hypothetical protein